MPGSYPVSALQTQVAISWGTPCTGREGTVLLNMAACCQSIQNGDCLGVDFGENSLQVKVKALVNCRYRSQQYYSQQSKTHTGVFWYILLLLQTDCLYLQEDYHPA